MGRLYRKKRGKFAERERPRIEWEDHIGRKEECLQEEKGLGLNGRFIQQKRGNSAGKDRPRIEWEDYIGRKVECLEEGKG